MKMTNQRTFRIELDSGRVFKAQAISDAAAIAAAKFIAGITNPAQISFRRATVPMSADGLRTGDGQKYLVHLREIAAEALGPVTADRQVRPDSQTRRLVLAP